MAARSIWTLLEEVYGLTPESRAASPTYPQTPPSEGYLPIDTYAKKGTFSHARTIVFFTFFGL